MAPEHATRALVALALLALAGCGAATEAGPAGQGGTGGPGGTGGVGLGPDGRPLDWNEASHGNGTSPDYDRLFPTDRVLELKLRSPLPTTRIADQRLFGFRRLTFSSNFADDSQLREAYVAELLRDRGIPAARTSFVRVTVDVGEGDTYWGLYTMVEDPADGAMLDAQLGGRGENLYKPDGTGADWTAFDPVGFEKKTNEAAADWSDVEAAIAALHATQADPAAWRAGLEARFDAQGFLRWLAVNSTIENWDAYGQLAHNYYLYAAPSADGRLVWIPWDHNLSMGAAIGGPGGAAPASAVDELFHAGVGAQWPLISVLLADELYRTTYADALGAATGGLFAPAAARTRLEQLHALIAEHVVGARGELAGSTTVSSAAAFDGSVEALVARIETRQARVAQALAGP